MRFRISVVFFSNTDCTDFTDWLAYARDLRSSEGAIPKRAVRKGCYMDCCSILRSVGPTSIVFVYVFNVNSMKLLLLSHNIN